MREPLSLFSAVATSSSGPRRSRVVVVDDEPTITSALVRLLQPAFEAEGFTRAGAAISRALAGNVDVIVCDMLMPELSGMALYEAVTARNSALAPRFLFMIGATVTQSAAAFLERVPNERIVKPFTIERLRSAIARVARCAAYAAPQAEPQSQAQSQDSGGRSLASRPSAICRA